MYASGLGRSVVEVSNSEIRDLTNKVASLQEQMAAMGERMGGLARQVADENSQVKAIREQLSGIADRLEKGAERMAGTGGRIDTLAQALETERVERQAVKDRIVTHEQGHQRGVSMAVSTIATVGAAAIGAIVTYLLLHL